MRRPLPRGESGVTLLETLIAVLLMGISLLALASLVMTTIAASATHRATVRAGTDATEVAERIDGMDYVPCPAAGTVSSLYGAAFDLTPSRVFDERLLEVQFLKDRSLPVSDAASWQVTCPATDQGAQKLTIRATTRTSPVLSSDLTFVKRDDRCPAGVTDVIVDGATPTTVVRAAC